VSVLAAMHNQRSQPEPLTLGIAWKDGSQPHQSRETTARSSASDDTSHASPASRFSHLRKSPVYAFDAASKKEFDHFEGGMAYKYVETKTAACWSLVCVVLMILGTRLAHVGQELEWPWHRVGFFLLASGSCVFSGLASSWGCQGKVLWQALLVGAVGYIATSSLMLCGAGVGLTFLPSLSMCLFMAGLYAGRGALPGNHMWRKRGATCFVVTLLCVGAILVSYDAMSQSYPVGAGLYLSAIVPPMEMASTSYLKITYQTYVYEVRLKRGGTVADPVIRGDQKMYFSVILAILQAAMEGIRFAALLGGVIRDPTSNGWKSAVASQFVIDTMTRLALVQWIAAKLTQGEQGSGRIGVWRSRCHWLTLPSSATLLFHDLKFALGYPRYTILLVCFFSRSWQLKAFDTSEEMRAALVAGAFMLLAEIVEDFCVWSLHYKCQAWLPDWSRFTAYSEMRPEHPSQVVNNPSLLYAPMPSLKAATVIAHSATLAYIGFCSIVGERWILGLDRNYIGGDATIWWCSESYC